MTIFAALDTTDFDNALTLSKHMSDIECGIKLGMEFFYAYGATGVKKIQEQAPTAPVFLDLKSHDIPTTVMKAYQAIAPLNVSYVNLHALGGYDMMKKAAEGLREENYKKGTECPQILAVTILTSHDEKSLQQIGLKEEPIADQVLRLAQLTQQAGLDGVVCSGKEIEILRQNCGPSFVLMVPGIRPAGADANDQKRIMTPLEAMQAGATHLVIGRPITEANDPKQAAVNIMQSLQNN